MAEWQPIETAPKDGSWFMICRAESGFDSYEIGCFDPTSRATYEPVENGLFRKEINLIDDWRGFSNMHRATHWMPLPSPPNADRASSQARVGL